MIGTRTNRICDHYANYVARKKVQVKCSGSFVFFDIHNLRLKNMFRSFWHIPSNFDLEPWMPFYR